MSLSLPRFARKLQILLFDVVGDRIYFGKEEGSRKTEDKKPLILTSDFWLLSSKNMIKTFLDKTPRIHETAFIAENAVIIGDVEIGEEASVWYGCVLRGDVNFIRIGARTNIQDASVIHVSSKTHPTVLEEEITVGHRVTLHGCYVEKGCLIGIGAILLDGVRIGKNSLVAAGSLVTPGTEIPERSLVMGAPARVKRELTGEEVKDLERFWRNYVTLGGIYRNPPA
jgi:carbonic anhydrase/acetyltransferase-like protein (isoleucine patch superfamily)